MAIPFLSAVLPFLGKVASTIGSAALAGGKGVWNLAKFIPSAAGKLMAGAPLSARSYGEGAYGWTSPIGGNWLSKIPQALSLMQGLGGLGGVGGQTEQQPGLLNQQQYPMMPPQIDVRSPRVSYGDIISRMLSNYRGG